MIQTATLPEDGLRRALASLVAAFLLHQIPLTGWALALRPDFILVAVLFWALHRPARVGMAWAFGAGLLADFQDGVVFGQHAMAYVLGVYFLGTYRLRLLQFDALQQAAQMLPLLLGVQLAILFVGWLAVGAPQGFAILLPVLGNTLVWWGVAAFLRAMHGPRRL
jgi:rod shape-determining protein MreD